MALILTTERPSGTAVIMARSLGARVVAGYVPSVDGHWAKDASALCHVRIPPSVQKNEVEKFLDIARAFGMAPQGDEPDFITSRVDEDVVDVFFREQRLSAPGRRVGLFIGGKPKRSDRLWPVSHLVQLAELLKKMQMQVIALSPPKPVDGSDTFVSAEYLRWEEFRKTLGWECPVFQSPALGHVAAFIRRLDLFVCPDGGMLHLAAAMRTPTVGLFFSTDPGVWGHAGSQIILDGRNQPAGALRPERVAGEISRFLSAQSAR